MSEKIEQYEAAIKAGLSPIRASRWVRYLELKARRGETPITLQEAVAQPRS